MDYIIDHIQNMNPDSIPVNDLDDFIHVCTPFPCSRILKEGVTVVVFTTWTNVMKKITNHNNYRGSVWIRKMKAVRQNLNQILKEYVPFTEEDRHAVISTCSFDRYTNLQDVSSGKFEKRRHIMGLIQSSDDEVASRIVSACMDQILDSNVQIENTRSVNELFELYTRENSIIHFKKS